MLFMPVLVLIIKAYSDKQAISNLAILQSTVANVSITIIRLIQTQSLPEQPVCVMAIEFMLVFRLAETDAAGVNKCRGRAW